MNIYFKIKENKIIFKHLLKTDLHPERAQLYLTELVQNQSFTSVNYSRLRITACFQCNHKKVRTKIYKNVFE